MFKESDWKQPEIDHPSVGTNESVMSDQNKVAIEPAQVVIQPKTQNQRRKKKIQKLSKVKTIDESIFSSREAAIEPNANTSEQWWIAESAVKQQRSKTLSKLIKVQTLAEQQIQESQKHIEQSERRPNLMSRETSPTRRVNELFANMPNKMNYSSNIEYLQSLYNI